MRTRTILATTLVMLVALSAALAADVTGKWTAEVPGRNGQTRTQTFTFKADGNTLTGNVGGGQGAETPIANGKITGDEISFTVTMERGGNTIKRNYTGKVSGDEIKMKAQTEGTDRTQEFTAKRAK